MTYSNDFVQFLNQSTCSYQTIATVEKNLKDAGFLRLKENATWNLENNRFYYFVKNQSTIIAFKIPEIVNVKSVNIIASHTDSPCLKIKPKAEIKDIHYNKLNVETYGGLIYSSWLDRPLSISGRVVVKENNELISKLVDFRRPMAIINNVAIHQNKEINKGYKYNPQVDLIPFTGLKPEDDYIDRILARELNITEESIYSHDLFLYPCQKAEIWGENDELISSPRIDNLESVYTSMKAFINSYSTHSINFFAAFDNEEVGSITKQGMASSILRDTIERVFESFYYVNSDIKSILSNSFLISADNAHAVHPNHPELYDSDNKTYLNGGITIKSSSAQKYVSDALSIAVAKALCENANVKYQVFANKSDNPGGSTQAAISTINLPICGIDVGCSQLAMHSAFETCGALDVEYMINFMCEFYSNTIVLSDNGYKIIK